MKKKILLILIVFFLLLSVFSQGIIIDHTSTNYQSIPMSVIDDVQANIRFHYAHYSHGSQLLCGLQIIEDNNSAYSVAIGGGYNGQNTIPPYLPTEAGALCIYNGNCGYTIENTMYWKPIASNHCTENTLNQNPTINVSGWQWCEELNGFSAAETQQYLDAMNAYEQQYPNVTFVYMTSNAMAGGEPGYNRHMRCDQIRNYCIANNKVLYDFEDLDAWYNGEYSTYLYNGIEVPYMHSAYGGNDCGHANDLNSLNKGTAVWYMMARIRGWNPTTNQPPIIENQTFSINENSPNGTVLGTVVASDPNGQLLTYSIIDGNINNAFNINSNTGVIIVNNTINYETLSSYLLTVKVEDNGSPVLSSQATITIDISDINENPIVEPQSFTLQIKYPNPYPSLLIPVGQIIASDPDIGQSLTFLMTQGNQEKIIVDQSGKIFYNILSAKPIGIEESVSKYKKPQFFEKYNIMVQVSDNFNPPASSNAAIDITIYSKTVNQISWWIENETLYFKFPFENEDFGKAKLSDIYGYTIYEGWCYPGTNQINVSTLSGLYMLTITGGETGKIVSTKIIIQ